MLLGIDIGGTTISLGLVEGTRILKKICVPSFAPDATLEETLDYLCSMIEKVITPDVNRIGVGVPTLVDAAAGVVYDAANIPSWKEVPLKALLEKRFGVEVGVNNDANCYALGASAKLGHKYSPLVCITLGTGTGVGIVNDGKVFSGVNCGAGELCSLPYNGKDYESFCSKQFFLAHGIEPKEASETVLKGNADAIKLMNEFGRHLGELITVVMYAYDPGCVVLGGGVANGAPYFMDSLKKTLRERYTYTRFLDKLDIHVMPEADLALLGASLL